MKSKARNKQNPKKHGYPTMSTRKPDEEIINNFPSTSTVARRAECDAFVPGDEF